MVLLSRHNHALHPGPAHHDRRYPLPARPVTRRGKAAHSRQDAGNLTSNGGLVAAARGRARFGPRRRDRRAAARRAQSPARHAHLRRHGDGAHDGDRGRLRGLRRPRRAAPRSGAEDGLRAGARERRRPGEPADLSRLENTADTRALYAIGIGLIDLFCRSYATPPGSIVLDIDDTDDPVHGGQQLALFNTHAGGHCFQPIHIFEGNSGKPILSLLRPGKRPSGEEIARVLRHVIRRIRRHWPKVRILVRGDSHYCGPEVLDLLRRSTATTSSASPSTRSSTPSPSPGGSAARTARWPGRRQRCAASISFQYQAGSWSRPRGRSSPASRRPTWGPTPASSSPICAGRAKTLYEKVYCARGAHGEPDQGPEALHALRQDRLPPLAGQPVPAVPAHGRLLAAACACGWRRRDARAGAAPPSRRSARASSRSRCASRS